jgi:hypothetical protein
LLRYHISITPYFFADLIQRFHSPLDHMEGIYKAFTTRREFIHALSYPS